jgi:Kef-type K+ transport system membrane component KefB
MHGAGIPGLILLQALVILLVCRACAALFRRLGQPGVVGEIAGGLLLGPSLLGALWPQAYETLFPPDSLAGLRALSQLGLLLFLYAVGLEVDLDALRAKARTAAAASWAGIVLPFFLGVGAAALLRPSLAPAVPRDQFLLFMGIAMSVTAFPVLARILHEKGLDRTPLGAAALASAALDDVTAWCGLAVVVGLVNGGGYPVAVVASVAAFCAALLASRPLLARWLGARLSAGASVREVSGWAVALLLACSFATEYIGVHAFFGAFLAGVVTPRAPELRRTLSRQFEDFSSAALLPLFFALTGIRTEVGLLGDAASWLAFGLVLAAAVAGKFGGASLAARWTGMPWRESLALGALMNARGLVELVMLNVGYELGVLPPKVFAMMVLMALTTTVMTGPLLDLFLGKAPARERDAASV